MASLQFWEIGRRCEESLVKKKEPVTAVTQEKIDHCLGGPIIMKCCHVQGQWRFLGHDCIPEGGGGRSGSHKPHGDRNPGVAAGCSSDCAMRSWRTARRAATVRWACWTSAALRTRSSARAPRPFSSCHSSHCAGGGVARLPGTRRQHNFQ